MSGIVYLSYVSHLMEFAERSTCASGGPSAEEKVQATVRR